MKKLFTLIAAALLAVGVNAQHDVGNPTNGSVVTEGDDAGTWFDESTKTINFLKAWNYRPGWWLAWNNEASANTGNDFSEYDEFVVELSDIPDGMTVQCQIEDVDGKSASAQTTNADSKIVVPLSKIDKTKVRQAYLQASSTGSVKFVKAYFQTSSPTIELSMSNLVIGWGGTSYTPVDGVCTIDTDHNVIGWWKSVDKTKYSKFVVELANVEKNEYFQVSFTGSKSDPAVTLDNGSYIKVIDLSSLSADIDRVMFQGKANSKFTIKQAYFATANYVTENNITDHAVYGDTQDLGLGSLGSGAAQYDATTHTITFAENATNKGWWYDSTTGADYSHFDNVVIEFDPATTAEGDVVVEYNDGTESSSVSFNPGATCVVVPLNGTAKNNIKQIYIMGNPGVSVTLKSAYVAISSATPTANLGTPPTWTIAGSKLLVGSDWDTNDEKNNMTTTDNITYTLVKENVTLEANTDYKYKVVKNHSWDNENYGNGSDDAILKVTETAIYKVTFTFNAQTKVLTATAEKTGEAGPIVHTYSVMGNIVDDWKTDIDMTEGEGGIYTVTINNVAAGSYEFKVRLDHAWAIAYPSDNYQLTVEKDNSTVVITYNSSTNEVNATVTPPTGIEALTIDTDANALMYNLAGQRVDKDYKGVVIKNGKKVVVK